MLKSKPLWLALCSTAAVAGGCGKNFDSCESTRTCAPSGDGDQPLGGEAGALGLPQDEDEEEEEKGKGKNEPETTEPECQEDETKELACGHNDRGVQVQICSEGAWADGDCEDPDECTDDEEDEIACGRGDLGTARRFCIEGQWSARLCRHPENLISAGATHTCAVREGGKVYCWGGNSHGQLGNDDTALESSSSPALVVGLEDIVAVHAVRYNGRHTCAIQDTGKTYCWGSNVYGALGLGLPVNELFYSTVPRELPAFDDIVGISGGLDYTCAVKGDGSLWCWGWNSGGLLGVGDTALPNSDVPLQVPGVTDAVSVSANGSVACALRENGKVACWGANDVGQLGNGSVNPATSAAPIGVASLNDVVHLNSGYRHSCVVDATNRGWCWGRNYSGQLGNNDPTDTDSRVPVEVYGLSDLVQVGAGLSHSCGVRAGGRVACWGSNSNGMLGRADAPVSSIVPLQVTTLSTVVAVSVGDNHACALRADDTVFCWGYGLEGRLGYGGTANQPVPIAVQFPVE
jgi:alpha-tubulin suppressor-like RCC1 family protein